MSTMTIGLVLPDVLGTYGDDGNALVLRQRLLLRGQSAEILPINLGDAVPDSCDLYTVGGGEDTAQILAAEHLIADGGLTRAATRGAPILAICAGLQVLGTSFHAGGRVVDGLGLLDATTAQLQERMIGEIASVPTAAAPELDQPLTGFANHMGATIIGADAQPLGTLTRGTGNTDRHGAQSAGLSEDTAEQAITAEGAVQGSVIATYMHGPALARNPQLADLLIARALGVKVADLPPLGEPLPGCDVPDSRRQRLATGLRAEVEQLRDERLA